MASIIERKASDGTIAFFARVRRKGGKVACASFKRKADAKQWIIETEKAVLDGRYFERAEERKHTLTDAIERYLVDAPSDKIRQSQLKRWESEIGYMMLAEITPVKLYDVIAKWKREPNDRGVARREAVLNRHLSTLSVVFTAAMRDWGWLSRNPARDVRRQKEPRGRIRYLNEGERARLLDACQKSYCSFIYPVVVLALSTGMRKSEIMGLRWADVDLEAGILLLFKTKNKEPRRVAIKGLASELLWKHSKVRRLDTDLLFPGERSPTGIKPFDIRKSWEDARRRAGIENFVFHDLRHSCASYLAMNGATLLEIAEVLGHKTLDMVKRYSHLADSHTAGVVERMNKKIFG